MKISITDDGSGIAQKFADFLGATVTGRYIHIPEDKGEGYITGFGWGNEMRAMIRNYYLHDEVIIERTNELADGQDDIVFLLSGVFPLMTKSGSKLLPEQPFVMICKHQVSSVLEMPFNTIFGSITIAVSRTYLYKLFGTLNHSVVTSILEANENFVLETGISPEMIKTAGEFLYQAVPVILENQFYKLKCEELLCYIFTSLLQRENLPTSNMHTDDLKAIYAVKNRLLNNLVEQPEIALLAKEAGMSGPKLRKLFKQTFGKGIFEYYQSAKMYLAASLLKDKRLTVSEVGYQLGFSNLSHFSRIFEQYIGAKPKKFQQAKNVL